MPPWIEMYFRVHAFESPKSRPPESLISAAWQPITESLFKGLMGIPACVRPVGSRLCGVGWPILSELTNQSSEYTCFMLWDRRRDRSCMVHRFLLVIVHGEAVAAV
eukprot:scaffold3608_cov65-Phaeocystis_antarctica.AAC.6